MPPLEEDRRLVSRVLRHILQSGMAGHLPRLNDVNVNEDIPAPIREEMTFHLVSGIEDALAHVFGAALLVHAPEGADQAPRAVEPVVQH